jgi:hypothetical protein
MRAFSCKPATTLHPLVTYRCKEQPLAFLDVLKSSPIVEKNNVFSFLISTFPRTFAVALPR